MGREYISPDKTEVSGSSPEWPTKSPVPEELPIRELLVMLLGEEGERRLENQAKTSDQLFPDYYDLITNTHTPKSFYEAKRLLEQFRTFIGEFPPTRQSSS